MLSIELAQGYKQIHIYYEGNVTIIYLVYIIRCNGYHLYEFQCSLLVILSCLYTYVLIYREKFWATWKRIRRWIRSYKKVVL